MSRIFFEYCGISKSVITSPRIVADRAASPSIFNRIYYGWRIPVRSRPARVSGNARISWRIWTRRSGRRLAPDFPVGLLVTIGRIVDAARPAIAAHIRWCEQVDRRRIAARRFAREGPVQFVDDLKTMQPQRFGHRSHLKLV